MRQRLLTLVALVAASVACDPLEPLNTPPASVAGIVCAPSTGLPLKRELVACDAGKGTAAVSREVKTDNAGYFVCKNLPEGKGLVTVYDRPALTRTFQVKLKSDQRTMLDDTACRGLPGDHVGSVEGVVCNRHTGELIAGADVSLLLGNETRTITSSTDPGSLGHFLFTDVPTGAWVLAIEAPGYQRTFAVTVEANKTFEVDLEGECIDDDITGEGEGEGEGGEGEGEGGEGEGEGETTLTGSVRGHVCMFDGSDLAGATITVALADGTTMTTTADANGDWQLSGVPEGHHTVTIEAGSYSTTREVDVGADTVVAIPEDDCSLDQDDVKIAVIEGIWDDVYSVLMDVGIDPGHVDVYDQMYGAAELLGDPSLLATYDSVLINCGADEYDFESDPTLRENLFDYVIGGGNLYASDLAYDFVEQTFPSFIDFVDDDTYFSSAEQGIEGDVSATITDSFLASAVGTSSITLHYPYAIWAVMQTAATPDVRVLIRGDALYEGGLVNNAPHTVLFRPTVGSGKVVFSSFHQEPGINVQQERVLQILMFQL